MKIYFFTLLTVFLSFYASAQTQDSEKVRLALHLADYLRKDYPLAVKNGKILNANEYEEQVEFSITLLDTLKSLKIEKSVALAMDLQREIKNKSDPRLIESLCIRINSDLNLKYAANLLPVSWPNVKLGAALFTKNCSDCHGVLGDGNGKYAQDLLPKPTNFLDNNLMGKATPMGAFNAIRLGIEGTGMRPFKEFSDEDTWNLAFFVLSLRHVSQEQAASLPDVSLADLTTTSDDELKQKFTLAQIASLRKISISDNPIILLRTTSSRLEKIHQLAKSKNFTKAIEATTSLYLDIVEPLEPRIKATSPSLVSRIEGDILLLRSELKRQDLEKIAEAVLQVEGTFVDIRSEVGGARLTPAMTFASASAVLLREGFEAVLIILALLSVLRGIGSSSGLVFVHAGWLAAVLVGVGFWFLSGKIIDLSGAQRENLEAIISFTAVFVLLYMGFWLHSQTEINRWKQFLGTEAKKALETKKLIGIFLISFVAVFREAFESVLFLRAIWFETTSESRLAMASGIISSFVIVVVFAWALLKYTKKVPLKILFTVTSGTVAVLAVVLMGKGIKALQETAMLGVTTIPFEIKIDLLGVYPSWECILSQLLVAVISIILWKVGTREAVAKN